jgi:hypothetical protein
MLTEASFDVGGDARIKRIVRTKNDIDLPIHGSVSSLLREMGDRHKIAWKMPHPPRSQNKKASPEIVGRLPAEAKHWTDRANRPTMPARYELSCRHGALCPILF